MRMGWRTVSLKMTSKLAFNVALIGWLPMQSALATELVYTPVNPAFGGNPLNGNFLLNSAQLQDDYKDPATKDLANDQSDLEQFNDLLQRTVLNRVASAATRDIIDATTGELLPGTLETTDFIIDIVAVPNTNNLQITTTDKVTGQTTTFQISNN